MFEPLLLSAHNPSPMTGAGNNTYVLASPGGEATLVDAGVGEPNHLADLEAALASHGARLASVVVTHGHRDHAAGVVALAERHPSARFAKHPWPEEDRHYPAAWHRLDDGDVLDAAGEPVIVLHTPGHSPDHLALWHQASATIFSGDLVVKGSSVMIHTSRGGSLAQYLASLERLLALAPRRLLPAHGPVIDDPPAVLSAYIAHRMDRERQVVDALRSGAHTVQAIADCIYHGLSPALMPAAQENVRAHLDKLKAEGRAVDRGDTWSL